MLISVHCFKVFGPVFVVSSNSIASSFSRFDVSSPRSVGASLWMFNICVRFHGRPWFEGSVLEKKPKDGETKDVLCNMYNNIFMDHAATTRCYKTTKFDDVIKVENFIFR